ncbi:MAG: 23S rRNA (pseudouridine(1915)-N(3))-methyltransferase RlmH [Victivallaceae bacterium]|nr:23S rRNA (pseudouridine(1915)-N(3))-methyltransferase RlmH [Victivallaceae bacterium]
MLIKIIAVGKIKDRGLQNKIDEFIKWISPYAKIEMVELRDSNVESEGTAILKALNREKAFVFALSEEGREFSSSELARELAAVDRKMIFIIGGPFGLSPAVKQGADMLLSLSKMTFTHEMARLFLVEQIYRAIDIARGGKYHNQSRL